MRLHYLTLNKIIDTAYFCGLDNTPVSMIIAAPSGAGKTWSSSAISESDFVLYMTGVSSPNEHRKIIQGAASRTRLLINDDLGLTARWNQAEYYATFCMIADGKIQYTVWRTTHFATTKCSLILCCTRDYYRKNVDMMIEMGLLDRVVPIILGLSDETRKAYQRYEQKTSIQDSKPSQRDPIIPEIKTVKTEMLSKKDIDPRLLHNLRRMSQYLTEDETEELIEVAHSNGRFEI